MANPKVLCIVFSLVVFDFYSTEQCKNPSPSPYFNATECVSRTWFLYAENTRCDNCCTVRTMVFLTSGLLEVTDTTIKDGVTEVIRFTGRPDENLPIFYADEGPSPYILVDTNCKTYAVIYCLGNGALQVWTHDAKQNPGFLNTLEGVRKCGVKLYKYNPEETCEYNCYIDDI